MKCIHLSVPCMCAGAPSSLTNVVHCPAVFLPIICLNPVETPTVPHNDPIDRTAERKKPKSLSPTRSRKTGSSTNPAGSRSPPRTRTDLFTGESLGAGTSAPRREGSKDVAPGTGTGVTLEQVLMHNFHNNRVEGLHRTISGEKGSQVSVWCVPSGGPAG